MGDSPPPARRVGLGRAGLQASARAASLMNCHPERSGAESRDLLLLACPEQSRKVPTRLLSRLRVCFLAGKRTEYSRRAAIVFVYATEKFAMKRWIALALP